MNSNNSPETVNASAATRATTGAPWPPVVNILATFSAAPFETSAVPAELAEYPELFSKQSGIDISASLVAAVTAAAAAIPDQIQLCADPRTKWYAQSRLWTIGNGPPGCGKTPVQRAMMAPLWSIHNELNNLWRVQVQGMHEDEKKKVPRPRAIVTDATLEALADVLAENERGITIVSEELDSWLGSMDQYRSGAVGHDRGEWLKAFDGGHHSVERVKRGTIYIRNWGCSILSATTPAAMKRFARHLPEDGLIQRFIIVQVQRRKETIEIDETVMSAAEDRYAQTIRRLWDLKPQTNGGIVTLSSEAKERFKSWQVETGILQESLGSQASAIEGHLAKHPTLALRLALIFHSARVVNLDDHAARDPALHQVSLETLELAFAFLRSVTNHAVEFYVGGNHGSSDSYELARALARFILARDPAKNGMAFSRRDLIARVHEFRKADEGLKGAALELLVTLGWIRVTRKEGQYLKPQPTQFAVNPTIHTAFAGLAEKERARRAIARKQIEIAVTDRRNEVEVVK